MSICDCIQCIRHRKEPAKSAWWAESGRDLTSSILLALIITVMFCGAAYLIFKAIDKIETKRTAQFREWKAGAVVEVANGR